MCVNHCNETDYNMLYVAMLIIVMALFGAGKFLYDQVKYRRKP